MRLPGRLRPRRRGPDLAGPRLLAAFAGAHPDATFVEVGANDGDQHDLLRPHVLARSWRGVMLEPVPYVFERLRRNVGHLGRVALENAALADHDGTVAFFHLAEADAAERERAALPGWYDGIGSLSREFVLGHAGKVPGLEERLVRTEVPCLTFASLCRRHRLERVDLLLLDAEGQDGALLRTIDLAAHDPRLIVFEHFHLSAADRAACHAAVRAAGYVTMEEGFDTFCVRRERNDALLAALGRLRPAVPGVSVADERR